MQSSKKIHAWAQMQVPLYMFFSIIPEEANMAKHWILKNILIKTFVLVLNYF